MGAGVSSGGQLSVIRRATMLLRAVAALDAVLGVPLRLSRRVQIGRGTRVSWHKIRVGSGNRLIIGNETIFNGRVSFEADGGQVRVGDRCYVGNSGLICHSSILIGNDVIVSWGCTVVDHNSHSIGWSGRKNDVREWAEGRKDWASVKRAPVVIEDRVWIGFNVSILKGVRIGEGSVIGAASVVTKDVPPYSVVGGNPARVIRPLLDDER
jgi:acetyltransferase-like isoleucine patch superfamily enzyme